MYYGISYIKKIGKEWSRWRYKRWAKRKCSYGYHLWDECASPYNHYLHCDACGVVLFIADDKRNMTIDD